MDGHKLYEPEYGVKKFGLFSKPSSIFVLLYN